MQYVLLDTSESPKNTDLAQSPKVLKQISPKSEEDKIDIDKLKTVSADLSKLSHIVKNDAAKITRYN